MKIEILEIEKSEFLEEWFKDRILKMNNNNNNNNNNNENNND